MGEAVDITMNQGENSYEESLSLLLGILVYLIVWVSVATAMVLTWSWDAGNLTSEKFSIVSCYYILLFSVFTWFPFALGFGGLGAIHVLVLHRCLQPNRKATLHFSVKIGLEIGLFLFPASFLWFAKTIPYWPARLETYGLAGFITATVSGYLIGLMHYRDTTAV